jgi:hypothetical protein
VHPLHTRPPTTRRNLPPLPCQTTFRGLNKSEYADRLERRSRDVPRQMRPELCLQTSIVSDGSIGLGAILPIHPLGPSWQAGPRKHYHSSIVTVGSPYEQPYSSAREARHAHSLTASHPLSQQNLQYAIRCCPQAQDQDLLHNKPACMSPCQARNSRQCSSASGPARSVSFAFRDSSFDGRGLKVAAAAG